MQKLNKQQIVLLVAGVITLLLLGMVYVWSIFVAPLEAEFGWDRAQTSHTFTISMVFFSLGMLAAGWIGKKKSLRFANLLGICFVLVGFVGVSQTSSLMMFYILYGVLAGFGIGICYNSWLPIVLSHFPGRVGMASGWLLLGFGIGGVTLGPLVHLLLSSPFGWRNTFLAIGIFIFIEGLIAMRFLHARPPDASDAKIKAALPSKLSKEHGATLTGSQTVREPSYWIFCVWKTILFCTGVAVVGQAAPIMLDMGATPAVAALAVSLISAGNGVGRVATGWFMDRFGYKLTMIIPTLLFFGSSLTFFIFYPLGIILPIHFAMFFLGVSYSAAVIVTTAFISNLYGQTHFSVNSAIAASTNVPAFLLLSSGVGILRAQTGVYSGFFIIMIALAVISWLLIFLTEKSANKMLERQALGGE
ncbi:MAG: MFS transporter [Oscillospiraceae bacterium]|nr:MFS transporter [Oscillospiraceae bacterium]